MTDLLPVSTYFCVSLTLVAFGIGSLVHKKLKLGILKPILIGGGNAEMWWL